MDDDTAARLSLSDRSRARPNDFAAMRARLHVHRGDPRHSSVGRQWACLRLFRHLAIDHQHGDDDHHVPHGVPDPEHSKPRHHGDSAQAGELIRANENAQNRMMKLEDLTEESLAAGPLDAIREPLEAAQEGLAEVSGNIEEAKSRLSVAMNELDRLGAGIPCSAWLRGTPDLIGGDRIRLPPL